MWKHGYTKGNIGGFQNFRRNSNSHYVGRVMDEITCECGIDMAFKT
jgi:hypothetical protein